MITLLILSNYKKIHLTITIIALILFIIFIILSAYKKHKISNIIDNINDDNYYEGLVHILLQYLFYFSLGDNNIHTVNDSCGLHIHISNKSGELTNWNIAIRFKEDAEYNYSLNSTNGISH